MQPFGLCCLLTNSLHVAGRTRLRPEEAATPLLAWKTSVRGLGSLVLLWFRALVRMIAVVMPADLVHPKALETAMAMLYPGAGAVPQEAFILGDWRVSVELAAPSQQA